MKNKNQVDLYPSYIETSSFKCPYCKIEIIYPLVAKDFIEKFRCPSCHKLFELKGGIPQRERFNPSKR